MGVLNEALSAVDCSVRGAFLEFTGGFSPILPAAVGGLAPQMRGRDFRWPTFSAGLVSYSEEYLISPVALGFLTQS